MLIFALIFHCYFGSRSSVVAKVIAGEAGGEGIRGMRAVACVIQNRMNRSGKTARETVLAKSQFASLQSPRLNKLYFAVKPVADRLAKRIGSLEDITDGATSFENVERFGHNHWTKRMKKTCKIGNHTFFK